MVGDLFDSPWKILIVVLVIIVLFGSKKLPGRTPRPPARCGSPASRAWRTAGLRS